MSVLAAAELVARLLSCCICTPYRRASRLSVQDLSAHVVVGKRSWSALGPSGHSLLGPRTLGCGYKGRR
eukprot:1613671-Prymnesium_polylepis.1